MPSTYLHHSYGREEKQFTNYLQGQTIFAFQDNFARTHHIDLRRRNPLDPFDTDLRLLLVEVINNGYTKDLILDIAYLPG